MASKAMVRAAEREIERGGSVASALDAALRAGVNAMSQETADRLENMIGGDMIGALLQAFEVKS